MINFFPLSIFNEILIMKASGFKLGGAFLDVLDGLFSTLLDEDDPNTLQGITSSTIFTSSSFVGKYLLQKMLELAKSQNPKQFYKSLDYFYALLHFDSESSQEIKLDLLRALKTVNDLYSNNIITIIDDGSYFPTKKSIYDMYRFAARDSSGSFSNNPEILMPLIHILILDMWAIEMK